MRNSTMLPADSTLVIENQRLVQRLEEALRDLDDQLEETSSLYEQLAALYHMFGLFGQVSDAESVARDVLRFCLDSLGATKAFIALLERDKMMVRHHAGLAPDVTLETSLDAEEGLFLFCRDNNRSAIVNDFAADSRMRCPFCAGLGLSRVICAPLSLAARVIGFLVVADTKDDSAFTAGHGKLVSSISHPLANVLENARLRRKEIERKLLEHELEIARGIQERLLPKVPPSAPTLDLSGRTVPAHAIGGDYYDFFFLDKDRIAVVLADAVGKGVSAGLLMTLIKGMLQTLPLQQASPGAILEALNRALSRQELLEHFVTMVYCTYNRTTRSLCLANAGHEPPLLFHGDARDSETLSLSCLPLGVEQLERYQEHTITLAPGDVLLVYSDGLTEARNRDGEEFGVAGVQRTVQPLLGRKALDVVELLHQAVVQYAGMPASEQADSEQKRSLSEPNHREGAHNGNTIRRLPDQHDDMTSIVLRIPTVDAN